MDDGRRDPRNVLLGAALEFGEDWRRDVRGLAAERLPELSDAERAALAREVEDTRAAIERWVRERCREANGAWSRADAEAADAQVRQAYPWVDEANRAHAVSQAVYYAWHG